MSANGVAQEIAISDIKIGKRYRKQLGDIDSLAKSIESIGLLQPVVLDCKNKLLGGERRIEACKRLGRLTVPYVIADSVKDAISRLVAERDENTCREEFRPSEKISLADRIEEMVRSEASRRERRGTKSTEPCGNLPQGECEKAGKSRDIIGAAIGMSGKTYEKAKAVVDAARDNPNEFGKLVEQMDATGKVDGAYRKLKEATEPKADEPSWTLDEALSALTERIEFCAKKWPRAHREMFRMHLQHAADDALELMERIDGSD